MNLKNLERPLFIVDEMKAKRNIERIAGKARDSQAELRAHVKTCQSGAVAQWLREFGVNKITVSSLDMAEYFMRYGWSDITLAVPVNIHQIDRINSLARGINFHVITESPFTASELSNKITNPLNVWIEIDTGYHRTGVAVQDVQKVLVIADVIQRSSPLVLAGILTHAGHVYDASSPNEIPRIHAAAVEAMISVKRALLDAGFKNISISTGDTPSSTLIDKFEPEIDEIRPGNFIFYDWMQVELGSCREEDIAAGVCCPVIAKNLDRNEITIYGGRVHLSSETMMTDSGQECFGKVASLEEDCSGWTQSIPDVNLFSLSQEHGCMSAPHEIVDSVQVGDVLTILPIHACITADLHSSFQTLDGKVLDSFRL